MRIGDNNDSIEYLFESILNDALIQSISDIHIEVRQSGCDIRMRENGEIIQYQTRNKLTCNKAKNLCSLFYNVFSSNPNVYFDPTDCQQTGANYYINNQDIKIRYQSLPAYPEGFDVVLRVLPINI